MSWGTGVDRDERPRLGARIFLSRLTSSCRARCFFSRSVGCIFGELLIKDAIMKGTGELDVSIICVRSRTSSDFAIHQFRRVPSSPPPTPLRAANTKNIPIARDPDGDELAGIFIPPERRHVQVEGQGRVRTQETILDQFLLLSHGRPVIPGWDWV